MVREFDGNSNAAGGKYEVVSDIIFTNDGKRTVRIVRAPVSAAMAVGARRSAGKIRSTNSNGE